MELSYKPSHLHPKPTLIITASHNRQWRVLEDLDSWRNPVIDLPRGIKKKSILVKRITHFVILKLDTAYHICWRTVCWLPNPVFTETNLGMTDLSKWLHMYFVGSHTLNIMRNGVADGTSPQMVLAHPPLHTPSSAKNLGTFPSVKHSIPPTPLIWASSRTCPEH